MAQKPIEASKIESAMEVRAAPAVVVGQPVVPTAAVVSQPAMVAGTAVPGVLNDSGVQRGQWTSSFCGCFDDVAICCITCVCPCITYGQNSQKMGNDCFMDGLIYFLLEQVGCCCLVHMGLRKKIRDKYQLPEECGGDCFATCCCSMCAICQEANQLKPIQI